MFLFMKMLKLKMFCGPVLFKMSKHKVLFQEKRIFKNLCMKVHHLVQMQQFFVNKIGNFVWSVPEL